MTSAKKIAINKSSKEIENAIRLTKGINMVQLVSGNHITVYVDDNIPEELIYRAGMILSVHQAESIVFKCQDWPFLLRLESL